MSTIHRYAELRPDQLVGRLEAYPVAIAPWGALEWHGPHLPFGLDGLVAKAFCERLAGRTGAVLLPTTYLPITTLPHRHSISIRADVVREAWLDLFRELGRAGFRLVCLVSGHYAQGHEIVLAQTAEVVTRGGGPLVLAGTPLALLQDSDLLDHAGRWETSQLLWARPELVDLDALPRGPLPPAHRVAVLGQDPREATAEQGQHLMDRGLESWESWMQRLLREGSPDPLYALYAERQAAYQDYVQRYYRGSWEAAIQAWWQEHLRT
jgi:creatinine amidohydrolase